VTLELHLGSAMALALVAASLYGTTSDSHSANVLANQAMDSMIVRMAAVVVAA
jgi:hypothetical protein